MFRRILLNSPQVLEGTQSKWLHPSLVLPSGPGSHLGGKRIVVRGLAGQQDVREAFFLPHHNVPKSAVALVLADAISEPLVEHIVFVSLQLPLH